MFSRPVECERMRIVLTMASLADSIMRHSTHRLFLAFRNHAGHCVSVPIGPTSLAGRKQVKLVYFPVHDDEGKMNKIS